MRGIVHGRRSKYMEMADTIPDVDKLAQWPPRCFEVVEFLYW